MKAIDLENLSLVGLNDSEISEVNGGCLPGGCIEYPKLPDIFGPQYPEFPTDIFGPIYIH